MSWLKRLSKGVRVFHSGGSGRLINKLLEDNWKLCVYLPKADASAAHMAAAVSVRRVEVMLPFVILY